LNEITINLSVEQLYLLNTLAFHCNEFILSHLKTNYTHITQSEEIKFNFTTESLTHDSGIQSTEDSNKLFDQENNSITLSENKIDSQSNTALFTKK